MRIVAALGGNALLERGEPPDSAIQEAHVVKAAGALAPLARAHDLVITHGNGPQVGLLALESAGDPALSRPYPFDVLGAQTQGMIGYWLVQALQNALPDRQVACLVSRTLVDAGDPAFSHPTKFVGPGYDEQTAHTLAGAHGWVVRQDGARWRRAVPSPEPAELIDLPSIRLLADSKVIVICAGGGGVPVVRDGGGGLRGVEAVVDKDLAAALLAQALCADVLLLLTDVAAVQDGFGTAQARPIRFATPGELRGRSFPAGSMGPKIEAVCRFAAAGKMAAIGRLGDAQALLDRTAGTIVTACPRRRAVRRRARGGARHPVEADGPWRPGPTALPARATGDERGDMKQTDALSPKRTPPPGCPPPEVIAEFLRTATLAPSMHNTQPWRFRVSRDTQTVELYADPARMLKHGDPHGRAVHLACGAALFNLRLAVAVAEREPVVRLLPVRGQPLLLATVRLAGPYRPTETEDELHAVIVARSTNRHPFSNRPVPPGVLAELAGAATTEGAMLHFPGHAETARLLYLVSDAERELLADPAYRAELARWAGGDRGRDGIPDTALGPYDPSGHTPVRDFAPDRHQAAGYAWFEENPRLAVLSTAGNARVDWLRAGQALQRVLLTATLRGVAATPLTQPLETADAWLVRDPESGIEQPQMILRLGYGLPVPATPRRPVTDVLDESGC